MDDCYSMNEQYVRDIVAEKDLVEIEECMLDHEGDDYVGDASLEIGGCEMDIEADVEDVDAEFDENDPQPACELSDGSKLWKPSVSDEFTPKVGDYFSSHIAVESFYRKYATRAGFDIRLSNKKINREGLTTTRYFFCSKQGTPRPKVFDSLAFTNGSRKRRNTNIKRTGCKACFKVHYVKERDRYEVYAFVELHNHVLLSQDEMRFSRSSRSLSYAEQKTIFNSCSQKIGVTKGHRLRNSLSGLVPIKGGTVRDYHNYRRDMNTFVGIKDAQMLIDTMTSRQQICPEYFFEYKLDGKELYAIFWADETARLNYREFGDVISFDATFRTNRHAMSFVPFVAIDNHKNSVVVGAALISGETADHYTWILTAFLNAHGRPPVFVITDQCLAMKKAIPLVFPESKHHLCMWHIMKKVDDKIGVHLKNSNFRSELNKLVWDVNMERSIFDLKWHELMEQYSLVGDSWFEEMFNIRGSWIPAYFKDFPMSGLMKTTSRSESINAFFNVFHEFHNNLRLFLVSFDHAIDIQRQIHAADEVKMKQTVPQMLTRSVLEAYAARVYSRTMFFDVQEELCLALHDCVWDGSEIVDGKKVYTILDDVGGSDKHSKFEVVRDVCNGTIDCSCNLFIRNGYLCRHAFKVLFNEKAQIIPDRYVLQRWRRDLIPVVWLPAKVRYGESDAETEKIISELNIVYEDMIEKLRNDKEALSEFLDYMKDRYSKISVDEPDQTRRERKNSNFKEFLGVTDVTSVDVFPPSGVRNKGCGKGKRLIGVREKVAKKASKPKRVCRKCGKLANHDSRNCTEK